MSVLSSISAKVFVNTFVFFVKRSLNVFVKISVNVVVKLSVQLIVKRPFPRFAVRCWCGRPICNYARIEREMLPSRHRLWGTKFNICVQTKMCYLSSLWV